MGETEQKGRTVWDMVVMVMSSGRRTITIILALTVVTSSITGAGEVTGLTFDGWGKGPDGSGCKADIDASRLPVASRDKFDIALVCGYPVPTDIMKDTHISVSGLYTPQNLVHAHVRFSKSMMDSSEDLQYLNPKPPSGTRVILNDTIWFKAVLLPKNTDTANIQKLSDVIAVGGKLASEWPTAGGATRVIIVP